MKKPSQEPEKKPLKQPHRGRQGTLNQEFGITWRRDLEILLTLMLQEFDLASLQAWGLGFRKLCQDLGFSIHCLGFRDSAPNHAQYSMELSQTT